MTAQPTSQATTWFLEVPWEVRDQAKFAGATWDTQAGAWTYTGDDLPDGLRQYVPDPYSWQAFLHDLRNTTHKLNRATHPVTMHPRDHQTHAAGLIHQASQAGARGFLLGDDVGLGKTISVATAIQRITRDGLPGGRPIRNVLVVCPLAVVPHWRRTIRDVGGVPANVVVINYDRLKQLIAAPNMSVTTKGKRRKRRATTRAKNKAIVSRGTPKVAWDLIVYDEAHALRRDSQRTAAAGMLARYAQPPGKAPFVVWMSATPGQDPTELRYLIPLFSQLTKQPQSSLSDFGKWLAGNGFHVTHNDRFDTWDWTEDEDLRARDVERMRRFLFDRPVSVALRRLPTDVVDWPEVVRVPLPVDLSLAEKTRYRLAWAEFKADTRAARKLGTGKERQEAGRVARLRYRQKASLLRVPGTVNMVEMLLDSGMQVAVSCEFLGSLDAIQEALQKKKVKVAVLDGRTRDVREAERLRFQAGQATVALFTPTEAISLHAGESLPDGKTATSTPRATVVHDPRFSAWQALQIEGRCHRDGQAATVYMPYASGTVEEQIISRMVARMVSTKGMVGDDTSSIRELEDLLDGEVLQGPA